ncbi:MAG: tail fiber domain-containing protein [Ignavibacteriales bacterium]|nr:tail fiber domain-containing protein [Ignavibacteriales bacterium]
MGNSTIYDNGTNVGIGTSDPVYKFQVEGGDAKINGVIIGTGPGDEAKDFNTVFGHDAFLNNISGNSNVAIGREALMSNTTANSNIAIGFEAMMNSTTGKSNTACGTLALNNNKTGSYNTAFGLFSLGSNNNGVGNSALGAYAGANYGQISYNLSISYGTFVGYEAYSIVDYLTNVTCLGYQSHTTASNQIRIGNTSVTSIGGYSAWTNFSDGRYKTAIHEDVIGLDFIMKLHPVTYQLDVNRLSASLKEDQNKDTDGNITSISLQKDIQARNDKSQIKQTGFIAQEVEKAAKELGYDFSGVDVPKNENDFYGLRYSEFVVPIVKAVQEQQAMIKDQQKIIDNLIKRMEVLEKNK